MKGATVANTAAAVDWSKITGTTADRLRKPKIPAVPAHIVGLAQASLDSNEVKKFEFPASVDKAVVEEFARHLRNSGHHTKPLSSVSAVIDPEETGNDHLVHWKAGGRRGKASSA